EFTFGDVQPGTCALAADLQGFKSAATKLIVKANETSTTDIVLGLDTLREEVTVNARIDASTETPIAAHVERLDSNALPTPPTAPGGGQRFQEALPMIPGGARGREGLLNVNGSRSNQGGLTFNSAKGTDPVTGEDATELPIDAVSSVQVRGAAYAPEYGLSAG